VIDQSHWSHLLPRWFLWLLQHFSGAYVTTSGDGLLSNNVENTFNLYDGCTRC
jgi:hypothetical protein